MRVLVKNKNTFNTSDFNNVASISFANNTYTIVLSGGGGTYTFSASDFLVSLLYQ